jgi:serine/threonine-protein phosphatase 2A regulatory subunit B'
MPAHRRERQHVLDRYDQWQKLRERALQNAPGGQFPEGYVEPEHAPPSPTSIIDDKDIMDLSMELNAVTIDEMPGDLDESGMDRVPMADPGLDVRVCVPTYSLAQ